MIRSQTLTPLPVPISCVETDGVGPRNFPLEACHFLIAPIPTDIFELRLPQRNVMGLNAAWLALEQQFGKSPQDDNHCPCERVQTSTRTAHLLNYY